MTPEERSHLPRLRNIGVALVLGSLVGPATAIGVVVFVLLLYWGATLADYIIDRRDRRRPRQVRKRVEMGRDVRGRFAVAREPTAQDYAEAREEVEKTLRRKE